MVKRAYILLAAVVFFCAGFTFCGPDKRDGEPRADAPPEYLNHSDSARYVGMGTCRLCHQSIYNTFIKTGMGQSFAVASRHKSAADFSSAHVFDQQSNFYYKAFWDKDSLFFREYRMDGRDTVHQRTEQVNYIIGSGQHTNSHMHLVNGYLTQMPMTYYTQKGKWDLPPGFENGQNTRFSRKIGLECMSCHNGYPAFVMGSENKYESLPGGIDCERCHGPGSIHVAQRQSGSRVDTSKYIDYSIVNPAKLSIDAQFDICQRCHLQGNAVLKEGRSFYDFRPGMKLSDYLTVFLPKYRNADEDFIMASHADRLKQSACFIKSYEKSRKANALKPYKDALTCVTCHNPHVSVRETNKNIFNEACQKCHSAASSAAAGGGCERHILKTSNCVGCHMPVSGSTDIPHVSVHDHYIRKPVTANDKQKLKAFLGLYAINEKRPDPLVRARAYISQYEKFEQKSEYLDSALVLLRQSGGEQQTASDMIRLLFIKQDRGGIIGLVNTIGEEACINHLFNKTSYENTDAWTCYRVGEAYYSTSDHARALRWFGQAVRLAPFNLEFRSKLATSLATASRLDEAMKEFGFILKENPEFVPAYCNLGYIKLTLGLTAEALHLYEAGERLDPDNEPLLLNLAAYYMYMKQESKARAYLKRLLKINPSNQKVKILLQQLG